MNDFMRSIEDMAQRYGLKISGMDGTDVTLMVRMEIVSAVFIQIYRNLKNDKLNMALVLGNNRIFGFDKEGGMQHEHPAENPESHVQTGHEPELEEFILNCLRLLQNKNII